MASTDQLIIRIIKRFSLELVEKLTVKTIMVRQDSPGRSRMTRHERLNLELSRLKLKARLQKFVMSMAQTDEILIFLLG